MRRNLLFLLLPIIFLLACQISEEERIHQILNRREEALGKKRRNWAGSLWLNTKKKEDSQSHWPHPLLLASQTEPIIEVKPEEEKRIVSIQKNQPQCKKRRRNPGKGLS